VTALATLEDDPMLPAFHPIARRIEETLDTFTLEFDLNHSFGFRPGQFNMLYVPGYGEVPISISGDPEAPEILVHTIRSVGPTTRALSRLGPGDLVGVRGPFGTAWPKPTSSSAHVVVIAGGLGLAPLRPVILEALHDGNPLFIVYGCRTPKDLLFPHELLGWAGDERVHSVVTVDRGDPHWFGNSGVVTKFIDRLGFDPENSVAAVCGPEIMMRFAARELEFAGIAPERIHVSLERHMQCGIGHCGHCQLGPRLLCKDGPVVNFAEASSLMAIREL
jgi:NAD(P)H-flavin reductase